MFQCAQWFIRYAEYWMPNWYIFSLFFYLRFINGFIVAPEFLSVVKFAIRRLFSLSSVEWQSIGRCVHMFEIHYLQCEVKCPNQSKVILGTSVYFIWTRRTGFEIMENNEIHDMQRSNTCYKEKKNCCFDTTITELKRAKTQIPSRAEQEKKRRSEEIIKVIKCGKMLHWSLLHYLKKKNILCFRMLCARPLRSRCSVWYKLIQWPKHNAYDTKPVVVKNSH